MQISIAVEVEQPPNTQPRYQLWYLVSNEIGDEGCKYLSQSNWNNLQTLYLCISNGIETRTRLELRDANIYRSRSGTTSKHSNYVSVMVFRQQQYWS